MKQIEAVVANINDLNDGEMRQVAIGETEILLTRLDGKFHAVGAHCSHYKAPLAEGGTEWTSCCLPLAQCLF
ncbi:Rieske 2Fe-2S domain-containing protein [Nostoc sp. UHCC 0926]|uniref:Rieske 2Fe-2S domain-containing protein n=1 Tax=Nostoc sp. UHCC 0926 TaxID=3025190 RepID=UPI0023605400|nr:Rieske 2Fe-2S domain-containing protein [Nostoc sp. UHCC 0926]WDD31830.1 Rieske 2Fe-2S domain-containing protein [Nostoc sp. UHCC 0926]